MGYLFAAISVLAGATKGFCGKKISGYTAEPRSAAFSNAVRMVLCIVIGFFFVLFDGGVSGLVIDGSLLLISLIAGVGTSVFVITWLLAIRRGAYMLVDVFLTVGVVIPMALSAIFYNEKIGLWEIAGFLLLIVAAVILCGYSSSVKSKLKVGDIILLATSGIANGFVGFSQKMFTNSGSTTSASVYNFYTYVFSAIVLVLFFLFSKGKREDKFDAKALFGKVFWFVGIMAVCLFACSYFNTLAAKHLGAAQLYPLTQGAGLILSTIMSAVFFGEKIKPRLIVGVSVAFVGLLAINLFPMLFGN